MIDRGANTERDLDDALRCVDGELEVNGLKRNGYGEIVKLLRGLGVKDKGLWKAPGVRPSFKALLVR